MPVNLLPVAVRFMVSPDGISCGWMGPLEIASRPGWIDCTELDPEEFQQLVAEKQAERPYIIN